MSDHGRLRIMVENVNTPGRITSVDAAMYGAMRKAMLETLPSGPPGLTQAEMLAALVERLPEKLYPGGAKAGWWSKTVQLDLEAKGLVIRESTKPLRWHRA